MKKIYTLLLAVFALSAVQLSAQNPDLSRKFGKVTDYELEMTSYARDTSAVAVYLYEITDVRYDVVASSHTTPFKQTRNYSVKIKVLKPEGVSFADVEIPFYTTSSSKEYISGISAAAYNKVDGKTVKTEIKNKDIISEQVSDKLTLRKFSIPEVRVGTVIEYKYIKTSDFFWDIDPVYVQRAHPVIYHSSEVATPQYFKFNINMQGQHPVNIKTSKRNNTTQYYDDVRTCVTLDVPALDNEPHVWNIADFRTKIAFELQAIDFPGAMYKSYATSWQSVNESLDKSEFSSNLKMSNPLKDEVAAIKATESDEIAQIRRIHKLVMSQMNWNGTYSIWGSTVRQKLKNGAGNSGEVNFVLNSALRDAGFKTTPILLNPRQFGRLPYGHPSMDNIRTFVIMVGLSDGKSVIVDGTNPNNDINLIPTSLMVDRARIYGNNSPQDGWADLTNLSPNMQMTTVKCGMDEEGKFAGSLSNSMQNTAANMVKSRYRSAESEDKYVDGLETENDISISSYEISDLNLPAVTETMNFSMEPSSAGDFIYLKATVVPLMSQNMLMQQERKLPIEFSYPVKRILVAMISIPEGYEIEELPARVRMAACENGVSYMYQAMVNGQMLMINMEYSLNRVLFSANEYPDLHTFFGMMTEKNNSQIILRKI